MAEILHASASCSKTSSEIGLETGKLALVVSHVPIRGPLLEYSLLLSPAQPVTVEVYATPIGVHGSKLRPRDAFVRTASSSMPPPTGSRLYGKMPVVLAHLVLADVATLYSA